MEERGIQLNRASASQARIFIAGALSAAVKNVERAMDASPSEKEFCELEKILIKIQIAADEYWDRGQLRVVDDENAGQTREEFADELAQKIRKSNGKFQLMREAVAQWLEEGKWKDE